MLKLLKEFFSNRARLGDLERRVEALGADCRRRDLALDETRAALEYLQADMNKLRGRLTGGLRKKGEPEEEPQAPAVDVNDSIRAGTFSFRRRA